MAQDRLNGKWIMVKTKRSYEKLPKTSVLTERFFKFGNKRGGEFALNSILAYKPDLDDFFRFTKKEFDKITRQDCEKYFGDLRNRKITDKRGVEKKINPCTVQNRIHSIKALYRYALQDGWKGTNPMAPFRLNSNELNNQFILSVSKQILSREEVKKLVEATNDTRNRCILLLFYSLGLRISEISNLELGDLDMDRGKIVIREGKGNKVRINDMSSDLLNALRTWLIVRGSLPNCSKVFTSNRGNPVITEHLRIWLRRKCIDLGIMKKERLCERCRKYKEAKYCRFCSWNKHITPHSFRHTFITHALEDGVPIHEIATIVGHADINMTMKYVSIAQMKTTYLTKFKGFNGG